METIKRRKSKYVVLVSIIVLLFANITTYGNTIVNNFGSFKDYNAVILGNHKATGADVEGRLAIRGDSDTRGKNFSYGAAYSGASNLMGEHLVDTSIPTVMLAGKMLYDGTPIIEKGNLVLTEDADEKNTINFAEGFGKVIVEKETIIQEINRLEQESKVVMNSIVNMLIMIH